MSYLYDKLKEALGGSRLTDSKNTIINDWSPNSIRVIIISRNSIITVNHLGVFGGCTKKVDLDVNLVSQDLNELSRTNYGKPKLNTLLSKRSFSCLEEIYVDKVFMMYPRVFNLTDYVQDLVNSNSRLRYFGFGDFSGEGLREYLNKTFKDAYSKKDYGYCLAKDTNRPCSIEYKDTGNKEWYKKYYLRPQYYRKDRQGGDLDIHFRKIAEGYEEYLKELKNMKVSENIKSEFIKVVNKDIENIHHFSKVENLYKHVYSIRKRTSRDDVINTVFPILNRVLVKTERKVSGLTRELLNNVFGEFKSRSTEIKYISRVYEGYQVLDDSRLYGKLNIEKYSNGAEGFVPLGDILDAICYDITGELLKKGYKDLVAMALVTNLNIPDGKFSQKYLNRMERSKNGGSYQGYIDYIEEIVGAEV